MIIYLNPYKSATHSLTHIGEVSKLLNFSRLEGLVNPLPYMPILGSSSSAENKHNDGKNMDEWGYNYLLK